jgi:uncharacterized cupredoxin-like copper-binding protein
MRHALLVLTTTVALASGAAFGHDAQPHANAVHDGRSDSGATAFGRPGDPANVARTVEVIMTDAMRFSPATFIVKRGETVRLVVHNEGAVRHEMVLGTDKALREHAKLMRKFPEIEHADAHMVRVDPGGQGEMVWNFDKRGHFSFACLVPGHFEAGMKGKVQVE